MLFIKTEEFSLKVVPGDYKIIDRTPSFNAEIDCSVFHFSSKFRYSGINSRINISSINRFIDAIEKIRSGNSKVAVLNLGVCFKYEIHLDIDNIEFPILNKIVVKEYRNVDDDSELKCSFKTSVEFINKLYEKLSDFKTEYEEHIKMKLN